MIFLEYKLKIIIYIYIYIFKIYIYIWTLSIFDAGNSSTRAKFPSLVNSNNPSEL
jgi:hypothetical protein